MLVFQTNPFGIETFSYVKTFFCSNKFAQLLTPRVKTLYRSGIHCKPAQKNGYRSVTVVTVYTLGIRPVSSPVTSPAPASVRVTK